MLFVKDLNLDQIFDCWLGAGGLVLLGRKAGKTGSASG